MLGSIFYARERHASIDAAVTRDESNTAALLMKAGVLNRQERFDEALSCYERALAVHRSAKAY